MKISSKVIFLSILLISFYSSLLVGQEEPNDKVSNHNRIGIKNIKLSEIIPQQIPQRGEEKPPEKGRKLGPMEKSLLFPGWGQISEKRYGRGVTFMITEGLCLSSVVFYTIKGSHSYSNYIKAENTPDAIHFRQLTEKYDRWRNISLALGAVVWAVNLLDMSLSQREPQSPQKGEGEKKPKECHLNLGLSSTGELSLQLSLHF